MIQVAFVGHFEPDDDAVVFLGVMAPKQRMGPFVAEAQQAILAIAFILPVAQERAGALVAEIPAEKFEGSFSSLIRASFRRRCLSARSPYFCDVKW